MILTISVHVHASKVSHIWVWHHQSHNLDIMYVQTCIMSESLISLFFGIFRNCRSCSASLVKSRAFVSAQWWVNACTCRLKLHLNNLSNLIDNIALPILSLNWCGCKMCFLYIYIEFVVRDLGIYLEMEDLWAGMYVSLFAVYSYASYE